MVWHLVFGWKMWPPESSESSVKMCQNLTSTKIKTFNSLEVLKGFWWKKNESKIRNGRAGAPPVGMVRFSYSTLTSSGTAELCHIVIICPHIYQYLNLSRHFWHSELSRFFSNYINLSQRTKNVKSNQFGN